MSQTIASIKLMGLYINLFSRALEIRKIRVEGTSFNSTLGGLIVSPFQRTI